MGPQASSIAFQVDLLFWTITGLALFFFTIVAIGITYFAIRYRRRQPDEIPPQIEGAIRLELAWTFIPLVLALGVAAWAAVLFIRMSRPPEDAMEIYVVGRQWMWKAQHPTGQWENNELHVPVGRPVKLLMTSQDVIHNFAVPQFRNRQDVLPGRYTQMWFTATKPGEYNIFCSEYCGAEHSRMTGTVYAMSEEDYQAWLAGETAGESPAAAGQRLFASLGCASCHRMGGQGRAPSLAGLFGAQEEIQGGGTVTVDEDYIRESILNPKAKIAAGYEDIMPSFAGTVSDEQIIQLIAYIQSIGGEQQGGQQQGGAGTDTNQPGANPPVEPRKPEDQQQDTGTND